MTYITKDGKFNLSKFIDDNPGIKHWQPTGRRREIKSLPVACIDGNECYIPHFDIYSDRSIYKCKKCSRTYRYYIPDSKSDGTWDWQKTGWYLQRDSIFDIIKSFIKGRVAQ